MTNLDNHVRPKMQTPTDTYVRNVIGRRIGMLSAKSSLQAVARMLGCDEKTVSRARDGKGMLTTPFVIGLFWNDAKFREQLLAKIGERPVPVEAKCDTDALPSVSGAVHKLAVVQSPDSPGGARITDHECLEIESEIDAALAALTALKVRCDAINAGRAA